MHPRCPWVAPGFRGLAQQTGFVVADLNEHRENDASGSIASRRKDGRTLNAAPAVRKGFKAGTVAKGK